VGAHLLEEAIESVAGKLRELLAKGEPHTMVFMGGRYGGLMGDLWGRFCEAFGTPNNVGHSSIYADDLTELEAQLRRGVRRCAALGTWPSLSSNTLVSTRSCKYIMRSSIMAKASLLESKPVTPSTTPSLGLHRLRADRHLLAGSLRTPPGCGVGPSLV